MRYSTSSSTVTTSINNNSFFTLVLFITVCLLLTLQTETLAQNSWIGGTPGAETEWDNPRNWSANHVPNWTDGEVIIPNVSTSSGYFPIVDTTVPEIAFLTIESGAILRINPSGLLTVNGENTYNYGIQNIGDLYNQGQLIILETALRSFANEESKVQNEGMITLVDEGLTTTKESWVGNK